MAPQPNAHAGGHSQDFEDLEKGLYEKPQSLVVLPSLNHVEYIETILSPISPIHEGTTPSSSVPVLSLSWPVGWKAPNGPVSESTAKKSVRPKPKISRWILFQLWFNTYRKFFIFVTLLNLAGIIMASLGRFPYAENHLGALVLGNLLGAILMRNELFGRFLYIIAIYGLRSVRLLYLSFIRRVLMNVSLVGSTAHQAGSNFGFATHRRHPFGMRTLWYWVKQPCNLAASGANRVSRWLVFKIVDIIRHRTVQNHAVIVTGVITNALVIISVLSAFPWVRKSVFQFICWIFR